MARAFPPRQECEDIPDIEEIPLAEKPIACPGGGGGGEDDDAPTLYIPRPAAPISEASRQDVTPPHNTAKNVTDELYGLNELGRDLVFGDVVGIRTYHMDYEGVKEPEEPGEGEEEEDMDWGSLVHKQTIVVLEEVQLFGVRIYQHISWGVVIDARIKENKIGRIKIAGITAVKLQVEDSTHQFCRLRVAEGPEDEGPRLVTCPYGGHARVLWRDSETSTGVILFPIMQLPTLGVAVSTPEEGKVDVEVGGFLIEDVETLED